MATTPTPVALRPRPVMTKDTAFFWEAARQHRLVIQRCTRCGRLRHPPMPSCPHCLSLEWDTVDACGRGMLTTYTVLHRPLAPPFTGPQLIGVITLEEGTKLVAGLVGVERNRVAIGMPLQVEFLDCDPELTLPVFRPAVEIEQ